jgi:hypothetical protein
VFLVAAVAAVKGDAVAGMPYLQLYSILAMYDAMECIEFNITPISDNTDVRRRNCPI